MISDAHVQGPDDPNLARLTAFVRELDAELYLLGDIFQWWWGRRDAAFEAHRPLVDAIESHGRVHFVPGNHDFAAAAFFEDIGVRVAPRIDVRFGDRRFTLLHGDEADSSLGYAFTKAALRGPVYRAAMRLAGPARAQRIGLRLAGASYVGEPNQGLVEAQIALADDLLQHADVVVMGHSHAPGVHDRPAGTYVNLGDFLHHHTWLAVTQDGLELRTA